ncbi:MAG: type II toxin-antitoxin system PemK/MazF family toxin [Chloroflexi bacterium]|nr:type II toxin-antitoxin system PemK/MazF family toxin [Chloroflexota bacterium]
MTSSKLQRGDVVLLPFPLGQPTARGRRPAVILSGESYNTNAGNLIIAPVTSRTGTMRLGDHAVQDWQSAGLLSPSVVRAHLATVAASRVVRRLGALSRRDLDAVALWLKRALEA